MEKEQFKQLIGELKDLQRLLVLIASKSGAKSEDIGKCLGIADSSVRKILAGLDKPRGRTNAKEDNKSQ